MKRNVMKLLIPALVLISLLFGGCTRGFNINFGSPFNGIEKKDEVSTALDMRKAEKLQVLNETGNIDVSKTSGSQIKITMKKEVRGQVDEEVKSVLDEIAIFAQFDGDTCVIKAVTQNGDDFWKWKQKSHPMLNVNVNFYVELPEDLSDYDVKLVTGNIDIRDLAGSFTVNNTTGNLTLRDLTMTGTNKVRLITGNITVDADILDADNLDVSNITGNVDLSLPAETNASFSVRLTTGNIGGSLLGQNSTTLGGADINKTLGSGKTDVSVENVTGNISINKN